jgi:hypothetical protein
MKQFIEKYFTIIVFILLVLTFFKGCNDSRELTKVKNELLDLHDSVATKSDIRIMNQKTENFQNVLYRFGDSYMTLLNITGESEIENKSSQKALSKIKELNLNKNETLDK